ncbi:MAG: sulfatase-like hydrolase/transferase, partial [Croceitalea sp.]|nr:sulfatase-like hydrolase/transferase [Croceitalea sp.]
MFLVYNWSSLQNFELEEIIHSLVMGLRFDTSSILMMNLPFFMYWVFPTQRKRNWSLRLFYFVNIIFIGINIADLELIRFNGRRLTPFYFLMSQDVSDQIGQLIIHFWYLTLSLIVLAALFVKYFPKPVRLKESTAISSIVTLYLVLLPIWLLGVRGGPQSSPVREANAYVFSSPKLGNLALNSSFTFIYGKKSSLSERYDFFDEKEMQVFKEQIAPRPSAMHGKLKGANVMVIILESFAIEYMGEVNNRPGYTPFLDSLAKRSLFFENAYTNGRRSIDAIPSVLAGVPALGKEAFLLSDPERTTLLGYPEVLKENGYSTHFYHAAKNGSMFFDEFSKRIGFEKYFGLNEYPRELRDQDYDG